MNKKSNKELSAGTADDSSTKADEKQVSPANGNTNVMRSGGELLNTSLVDFVKSSPTVQAAITEAVHRFYYDRICSDKTKDKIDLEETKASDVLSTLWNLQPNWRYVLEKTAKRYDAADTNKSLIFSKPKNIVGLKLEIELV